MLTGFATTTEAAFVAVVWALFVGGLLYREITWAGLWRVGVETVRMTGAIMIIMAVSVPFSWILTVEQVPQTAAAALESCRRGHDRHDPADPVLLTFVGTWADLGPSLVILAPILHPIGIEAGLAPYQLGMIFVIALGIGLFTPPVGTNIFVVCNVAKVGVNAVTLAADSLLHHEQYLPSARGVRSGDHRMAAPACSGSATDDRSTLSAASPRAGREQCLTAFDGIARAAHAPRRRAPLRSGIRSGRRYIDTALGFGATILGHAPARVVEATYARRSAQGRCPPLPMPARRPPRQRWPRSPARFRRSVFTNTGSEAVHLACRIARARHGPRA